MRGVLLVVLVGSVLFFLAGVFELSGARAAAHWPARAARITTAEVRHGDQSTWMAIEGVLVDDGSRFAIHRYAYGVVNGLSPGQPYLAAYKPGSLTRVYVDPQDSDNVILCNTPSLKFQYAELAVTAVLALASSLALARLAVRRRRGSGWDPDQLPAWLNRPVELPRWVGLLLGIAIGLLFVALGAWLIHMGIAGRTPAQLLRPPECKIVMLLGVLFGFGGLQTVVMLVGGDRIPQVVQQFIRSLCLVVLGLPFLAVAILDPRGITSSTSIGGLKVTASQGSLTGAIVFVLVGLACLVAALWPWRWWKQR